MKTSNIIGLELIAERLIGHTAMCGTPARIETGDEGNSWITVPIAPEVSLQITPVGRGETYEITILPAYLGGSHPTTKVGVVAFAYVADLVRVAVVMEVMREGVVPSWSEEVSPVSD